MGGGHRGMLATGRAKDTKAILRRLWVYMGRQRGGLLTVIVMTALAAVVTLVSPLLLGRAIDHYVLPGDYDGLLRLCLYLLLLYASGSVLSWLQAYLMVGVSQRTVWELRNDLFARLQQLPLRFFDTKTHGELMSRTTNDIDNISNTLNQSVTQIITSFLTLVGSLAMMLALDGWLTLLSCVTIPLILLVTRAIAKHTRASFQANQKQLGELNGFIEETVSGQKVVQAYVREERASADFEAISERLRQAGTRSQILSGLMGPVMNVIGNLSFAIIAGVGGWMALKGHVTLGVVVSFLQYSRQFSRPVNELANQFNMIQSGLAGAERVFEIMNAPTEYEPASGRPAGNGERELAAVKGEVVFRDVTFRYKPDSPTLRGVSLTASPGETIALVGPTGAGKTTIINLLTRFYEIESGEITIDGADIRLLDKDSLRRRLGIVLQDAYLFADTIRENLRYGRLDATDAEIEEAATLANAHLFIEKLPDGYETRLTAEGGNLSQGQRQLLTIARAILADPAILILDEATSSVDTRTEMHIQEAMRSLMKGRTSFVIAHRLSTIREADQILVINGGSVLERGTHEELLEQHGFYHNLYHSQFRSGLSDAG
nr:ABC transporter ATP-binding protein [Paenibacillus sp. J31TS4]